MRFLDASADDPTDDGYQRREIARDGLPVSVAPGGPA
jgi:hypothetical protein